MKKLFVFLFILAGTLATFAQNDGGNGDPNEIRTFMGHNNSVGGYGALTMQYSQINNRDAFLFGAKGGILMGHMVGMGLAINGFFTDKFYDHTTGNTQHLAGGYGGFFFEPILLPKYPVHVSFPVLIGGGGIGLYNNHDGNSWDGHFSSEASDAFMVIEPGIDVEMNITHFFRFCIGARYRYTTDVQIENPDYEHIDNDVLRGFTGGVTFKFGRF
jgi:hypothetical protein